MAANSLDIFGMFMLAVWLENENVKHFGFVSKNNRVIL